LLCPTEKLPGIATIYKMANPWEDMFVKEFIPAIEKTLIRIRV
jgi:hypothetical protein